MCLCVSQLEDELGADGERQRGELVQLRRGLGGLNPAEALSHTHCDRGLFLKYTQ